MTLLALAGNCGDLAASGLLLSGKLVEPWTDLELSRQLSASEPKPKLDFSRKSRREFTGTDRLQEYMFNSFPPPINR